jgi:hypothetical protein
VLGLIQRGCTRRDASLGVQEPGDLAVDALGIDIGDLLMGLLVAELVPDGDTNRLCHGALLSVG